jgi:hypothetical protein
MTKRQREALRKALDRADREGVCSRCGAPLYENGEYKIFRLIRKRAVCCAPLDPGMVGYAVSMRPEAPRLTAGQLRIASTETVKDVKVEFRRVKRRDG